MNLKELLLAKDPAFWPSLAEQTLVTTEPDQLLALAQLRKKAIARGLSEPAGTAIRVALIGGYSLFPLEEMIVQSLWARGLRPELFTGEFDNYTQEILDADSELYAFRPELVFLMPSHKRCRYQGSLLDPLERQLEQVRATANGILELCKLAHERTKAEIVLANFVLPPEHDLGPFRGRGYASDWSFKRGVNTELGLAAPPFVHVADLELLAYRRGGIAARDARLWFESKQPCSAALMVDLAHEIGVSVQRMRTAAKKVLVLDLDNTLWGGVVGDQGIEGIEIGDTSPRGEAFKAFQDYILGLKHRGVLLAVASKNDHDKAIEPFEKHPEMVLRPSDFVSFKANWGPKSDSIRAMAQELSLGLDSFVFVDDNPAEIEIVRQFAPEVSRLLLGDDPSEYVSQLANSRFFEPRNITVEDLEKTDQYRQEAQRQALESTATDMDAYLRSLDMVGRICELVPLDVPRVSQLINKSNQFNLTTRRRTEAEVSAVMADSSWVGFSMRLADRFGDHGLIGVVIGQLKGETLEVETWLMSCRVLKRQVEEETVNEILRLARQRGAKRVVGRYLPTAKNGMVKDLYPRMGFRTLEESDQGGLYELDTASFVATSTHIRMAQRAYDKS